MQRHKSRSIERKTISKSIVSRPIEHHLPCLSKKQTSRIVTPISTSARVVNDNIHKATPIMSLKIQNAHKTRLTLIALCLIVASLIALADCMKRTQYHEQGIHGPKSYKFGFTSGDHKNPQERHEVSDKKGHVKGWYSYKDPHGKMMVYHYEAHPKKGFKVHKKKHHG